MDGWGSWGIWNENEGEMESIINLEGKTKQSKTWDDSVVLKSSRIADLLHRVKDVGWGRSVVMLCLLACKSYIKVLKLDKSKGWALERDHHSGEIIIIAL